MIVAITGTLSLTRSQFVRKYFLPNQVEFAPNVNKNTDYCIVGESPGQAKLKLAKSFGTVCITEEEFLYKIGVSAEPGRFATRENVTVDKFKCDLI